MRVEELEASLRESVEAWLRGGDGATARRLTAIEAKTWRTYQALPKNSLGRLGPQAVRYLTHNYFAKEHGWLIKGLEPHGMRSDASEVHESRVLQDKAPALVEALLEAKQGNRGLLLGDVVAMIAALEHLIFDESVALLETSYTLNEESTTASVLEDTLHEILRSYLIIFEAGDRRNVDDVRRHQRLKKKAAVSLSKWQEMVDFEENAVGNFAYQRQHQTNPFVPTTYSFEDSAQIVSNMAEAYGKWQDTECRGMKAALMNLSTADTGRVSLGNFYSAPETATYQFAESVDYLRSAGALDETGSGGPTVLVANYLTGPSNCIATSSYYSVCCINECEGLMNEIEEKVQAPKASAQQLLSLVGDLHSSTVDAPRELPQALHEKLDAVAARHGGEVPLHGRLFAQWLHFAFPNECPYPLSGSDAPLTTSDWLETRSVVSAEERKQHIDATAGAGTTSKEEEEGAPLSQWSDDEVLPLHEAPKRGRSMLQGTVGLSMQLAALGVALRTAASMWKSAVRGVRGDDKEKDFVLPLRA